MWGRSGCALWRARRDRVRVEIEWRNPLYVSSELNNVVIVHPLWAVQCQHAVFIGT